MEKKNILQKVEKNYSLNLIIEIKNFIKRK